MSNEFCLWVEGTYYPDYIRRSNDSMFGTKKGWRKSSNVKATKDIDGAKLFLVGCYDLYEDGYCVFATKDGIDDSSPDFGKYTKYEIIADVQFRGNGCYPSKYGNKYAGEDTFNGINSLADFEKLNENCYYFLENK